MLSFSHEQFLQLQIKSEANFVASLVNVFNKDYSSLLKEKNIEDNELKSHLENAFITTKKLNISEQLYVFYICGLTLEFGENFLENDNLQPHLEWLTSPYVPAKFKISRLLQVLSSKYFTLGVYN